MYCCQTDALPLISSQLLLLKSLTVTTCGVSDRCLCLSLCALMRVVCVADMDVMTADVSISTGLNWFHSLKRTSLRSISEKAKHGESWSCDQMYFCNFVQWSCWILDRSPH